MAEQFSRYELNRKVKQVLVRHAVDLSALQYSCAGDSVYLYGSLRKDPKGEFAPAAIETFVRELLGLRRVRSLQFDLCDWNINADYDAFSIAKRK